MSLKKSIHNSFFAALFFAIPLSFALLVSEAQGVSLTVQLSGTGAAYGRLFIMKEQNGSLVSFGGCSFQLDSTNLDLAALTPEQQTCVISDIAPGTKITVYALREMVAGDVESGNLAEVTFNSFAGVCTGNGNGLVNYYDFPLYECSFQAGETDLSLNASFDSPLVQIEDFVEESLDDVTLEVQNTGMSTLLKKKSLILSFPPSPQGGLLKLKLTAKYKLPKKKGAAFIEPAYANIILAAGKVLLSQTAATNMRLATTKAGRSFMKGKKQVRATLGASWSQQGASTAAVSQLKTLLMKRR